MEYVENYYPVLGCHLLQTVHVFLVPLNNPKGHRSLLVYNNSHLLPYNLQQQAHPFLVEFNIYLPYYSLF